MNPDPCDQLNCYLLGELDARQVVFFEDHLMECKECLEDIARTRETEAELRVDFASTECRDTWATVLLDRVRKMERVREPRHLRRKHVWRNIAAIAASGMLIAFWIWSHPKQKMESNLQSSGRVALSASLEPKSDSLQIPDFVASTPATSVRASAGYLSAKLPSDDPDIEIYQVLPQINRFNEPSLP